MKTCIWVLNRSTIKVYIMKRNYDYSCKLFDDINANLIDNFKNKRVGFIRIFGWDKY